MGVLPSKLAAIDSKGAPRGAETCFKRVDALSEEARGRSEADWDGIIAANATVLASALREAGLIETDSTLGLVGRQVDNVDLLFAELRMQGEEDDPGKPSVWSEPRRLVLLEDKLVRNAEAKRQVLAQILDYAEKAQKEWTAAWLSEQGLVAEAEEWLTKHTEQVDYMLRQGDLLLIIAGDDIDNDLLRLARRFAGADNPLSLNEICLVSMAMYRRGDEYLLVPHVVSAVERRERQLSIKVTLQSPDGKPVPLSRVDVDEPATAAQARRGQLPVNDDVAAFLEKAKAVLDPKLLGPRWGLATTNKVRKELAYWLTSKRIGTARFRIHFGGFVRDQWSPIEVGLLLEAPDEKLRDEWHRRLEPAVKDAALPPKSELHPYGRKSLEIVAPKSPWSESRELNDALVAKLCDALETFVNVLMPLLSEPK